MKNSNQKKHEDFIQLVIDGAEFYQAYLQAVNPSVSQKTAYECGSKLAKKYAEEIRRGKEARQAAIEKAKEAVVMEEARKSLLSQIEVDAKLCEIISGNFKVEEFIVANGAPVKATRKPNASEVRAAIDTYNRRFGAYTQKVDITTDGEKLEPSIIQWGDIKIKV